MDNKTMEEVEPFAVDDYHQGMKLEKRRCETKYIYHDLPLELYYFSSSVFA
jgi:hypothetical protein